MWGDPPDQDFATFGPQKHQCFIIDFLGWLWAGPGLALGWLWAGSGLALGWLWAGSGLALGWLWAGFGLALGWLWAGSVGPSAGSGAFLRCPGKTRWARPKNVAGHKTIPLPIVQAPSCVIRGKRVGRVQKMSPDTKQSRYQ